MVQWVALDGIGCSDFQTWFDNEAIGEKRNRMKQLLDHLDKKRETSERMEELKLQIEQVEKKGGDGQEKKAKALEAMTTSLYVCVSRGTKFTVC